MAKKNTGGASISTLYLERKGSGASTVAIRMFLLLKYQFVTNTGSEATIGYREQEALYLLVRRFFRHLYTHEQREYERGGI